MIYFDNAATTWKKPPGVTTAIMQALGKCGGNPGRSSHALSLAAAEGVDATRCALATLIGVPAPNHIIFCLNATEALNLAILTRINRGDHVLISDREHNAVYRPVCRLAREGIADFDVFSTQGNVTENIRALLRKNTRMLICNHVSNVDGAVAPVEEIGQLCRKKGIYFIVDASQSLGHMPLSAEKIGADALCGPGHKGLFGIQGCGFVYLKSANDLREFLTGGSGSASRLPEMPKDLPERMEAGTQPTPAIFALGAGIDFLQHVTLEAVAAHEAALTERLLQHLTSISGIQIHHASSSGVLSFTALQKSPDELTAAFDRRAICVRGGLHCAPLAHSALHTEETGTVRVSFSYFNTLLEVDRFAKELIAILDE